MTGRARLLGLAVLLVVAGSACQARLDADVQVREDGSGTIVAGLGLDDEALATVGDLTGMLAADDLKVAGWSVSGPAKEADGLTWMRLSHDFDDVEEANRVLEGLSGGAGPFEDLRLTRTRSWRETDTSFRGRVDLTAGLAGLADADLKARLAQFGFDPGLDLEGLRRRFGPDLDQALKVTVTADLPGRTKSGTPSTMAGRASWTAVFGQETSLVLDAELERFGWVAKAGAAGAGALFVLGVAVVIRRRRRRNDWR